MATIDSRISVRLGDELFQNVERACARTSLDIATVTRASLQAFAEYVEKHGRVMLPFELIPKPSFEDLRVEIRMLEDQVRQLTAFIHPLKASGDTEKQEALEQLLKSYRNDLERKVSELHRIEAHAEHARFQLEKLARSPEKK